jgi:hypothetical protein
VVKVLSELCGAVFLLEVIVPIGFDIRESLGLHVFQLLNFEL